MKGSDFCNKVDFDFNGAAHRDASIPKAVKTKINQANIPDELRPKYISVKLEDDYTICINWETQEWCWETNIIADEIERYYNYYAEKLGLEDDILVILRIRSRDSYADKRCFSSWQMHEYERLKEQQDVIKIPIYAVAKNDTNNELRKESENELNHLKKCYHILKKYNSDDYQNCDGNSPQSDIPVRIEVVTKAIYCEFKNTQQSVAKRWLCRMLRRHKFIFDDDDVDVYQYGCYPDAWVSASVSYKNLKIQRSTE